MSPKYCAYIVERLTMRFMAMVADHERQLTEHRAAFGARTEADAKIIAGLRAELKQLQKERADGRSAVVDLLSEHEGLRIQVQDMRAEMQRLSAQVDWERAEIKRLQWENATMHKDAEDGYAEAIKVLGDPIALSKERDALRAEVAALKSQTPRHPVKVGEWVKRTKKCAHLGHVAKVLAFIEPCSYEVQCIDGRGIWYFHNCEPCDPPEASHDTPAGKEAAESVIRDSQMTEIKVGNVVEVVSNTGFNTWLADVGSVGTVTSVETIEDSLSVRLADVPGKKNVLAGYVSLCDVRKVTT